MSIDGELKDSRLDPIGKRICTVTFCPSIYSGGGSVIVKAGQTVERPKEICYPDCELVDWYIDRDLNKPYDFSMPVLSDLNLYAKWVFSAPTHEVCFEDMPPVIVKHGSTVERPRDPKRDGYTFLGWYILAEIPIEDRLFLFNTPITQDINLNAVWKGD